MTTVRRHMLNALGKLFAEDNLVVIRNEGGLASQIGFWALGHELSGLGYDVKFDNSWFRSNGMDLNGRFPRNLDFPKAFPSLNLVEASKFERTVLKKLNNFTEGDPTTVMAPAYLGGFYDRWKLVVKHQKLLTESFSPDDSYFSKEDLELLEQIKREPNMCGVHVRRGDLSNDHQHYGKALGPDYFTRAIAEVGARHEETTYYFFSDEPDWVKENIGRSLGTETSYVVVDNNGSDRGFVDLYLLSQCQSFVSSQGAFGKYARLLGDPSRLIIEPSSHALFSKDDKNVIVLNV